eukprot:751591-Hanusia_phi.AAC.1
MKQTRRRSLRSVSFYGGIQQSKGSMTQEVDHVLDARQRLKSNHVGNYPGEDSGWPCAGSTSMSDPGAGMGGEDLAQFAHRTQGHEVSLHSAKNLTTVFSLSGLLAARVGVVYGPSFPLTSTAGGYTCFPHRMWAPYRGAISTNFTPWNSTPMDLTLNRELFNDLDTFIRFVSARQVQEQLSFINAGFARSFNIGWIHTGVVWAKKRLAD